jgi:ATP-dependent RNA helicase DDX56/DBP9
LIATDDNKTKEAKQTNKENKKDSRGRKHMQQTLDAEFGVVRGIDFKNVFTVSISLSTQAYQLIQSLMRGAN